MAMTRTMKLARRLILFSFSFYLVVAFAVFFQQRSMLYFPSHRASPSSLTPWTHDNRVIGYCRERIDPKSVWLMAHGNAGQAADRDYVLPRMSDDDSLYVLEYPGYGQRDGIPCLESMNQAAIEAYRVLRAKFPGVPICVLGESIGSGPVCTLATEIVPPDKVVLVVPFDSLASVASKRFFFLPVRLMLLDDWDNVSSLQNYPGPVDVFAAENDQIIPQLHAKALADQVPRSQFWSIPGGHNDWSLMEQVQIRR